MAEVFRITDRLNLAGRGTVYTIDDIKRILTTYMRLDIEPDLTMVFRDRPKEYMIIGYPGHVSFQRCGYKDGSGEMNFPDLEMLFSSELIDGICLQRDWHKVTSIWCEPSLDDTDDVIEAYRAAAEKRNERLGNRYHIFRAVQREVERWNPYGLLPDAPADEFNFESESIAEKIDYGSSVEKIARVVSRVFSEAFGPQYFTVDKCMNAASNIREAMDKGNIT